MMKLMNHFMSALCILSLTVIPYSRKFWQEKTLVNCVFGKENFGKFKPSLYSFFRYYKQLADKTLANS